MKERPYPPKGVQSKGRPELITVGSEVYMRACPHGTPGVVVRYERTRWVVWWSDLDYLARHSLESLEEVGSPDAADAKGTPRTPAAEV
jgi:hypothetical protein